MSGDGELRIGDADRFPSRARPQGRTPALPEWLTPAAPAQLLLPPASAPSPALPRSPGHAGHEDKAALRKRAKLRQDENAIGHAFQAVRRAIDAELETATASGDTARAELLRRRLKDAHDAAAAGRQAVAAGDRATAQQQLARIRRAAPAPNHPSGFSPSPVSR
jgi:hypothetical protein